jgi:hypothetical protein
MKFQKKNINAEIDWDKLDTFWADQYEANYGQYFSTTQESSFSDTAIFKSNELQIAKLLFNQLVGRQPVT